MKPWQMMRGFGATSAGGGGGGDPDFASRSAILNFDGSYSLGDSFAEVKGHTVNVASGSISGGAFHSSGSGGGVTIADNAVFDFGTGYFLIEMLVNFSNIGAGGYQTLYAHGYIDAGHLVVQSGDNDGKFNVYVGGSTICTESSAATTGVDYWYEIARSGTTVTIKRNGVTTASGTSSASLGAASSVCLGGALGGGGAHGLDGDIKAARISKGIAASTLPPSDPLPES